MPIAKSIPERIVDYITTMRHDYTAAMKNNIDRSLRRMNMPIEHIRKVMTAADTAQTAHAAYLAMQGVRFGKLRYDVSKYLWEATEGPNIDRIKGEVIRIGQQYGLSEAEIMDKFQDMMVARRVKEIHEEADKVLETYKEMRLNNPKDAKTYLDNNEHIVKISKAITEYQMTAEEADAILESTEAETPELMAEEGPIKTWNEIRANTIQDRKSTR